MSDWDTEQLVADDKKYVWHPFTPIGPMVCAGARAARVGGRRGDNR